MSNLLVLDLLLLWEFSLDLFDGTAIFCKLDGVRAELVIFIFSSSYASSLFCRDGNGFICPTPGTAGGCPSSVIFLNVCVPLTVLRVSSTSNMSQGREHQKNPKKRLHAGFNSQAIVCKNIYAGFIQFMLKDLWKPM